MASINENYQKLKAGYLFPEIRRRTEAFAQANPAADIIRMGIGDVVRGIPRVIVDAMKDAAEELADDGTFRGYPPEQGYDLSNPPRRRPPGRSLGEQKARRARGYPRALDCGAVPVCRARRDKAQS